MMIAKMIAPSKVWPSAYASGRLVQCRKAGAANYGKGKKKSKDSDDDEDEDEDSKKCPACDCDPCECDDEKAHKGPMTRKGPKSKSEKKAYHFNHASQLSAEAVEAAVEAVVETKEAE